MCSLSSTRADRGMMTGRVSLPSIGLAWTQGGPQARVEIVGTHHDMTRSLKGRRVHVLEL